MTSTDTSFVISSLNFTFNHLLESSRWDYLNKWFDRIWWRNKHYLNKNTLLIWSRGKEWFWWCKIHSLPTCKWRWFYVRTTVRRRIDVACTWAIALTPKYASQYINLFFICAISSCIRYDRGPVCFSFHHWSFCTCGKWIRKHNFDCLNCTCYVR